MKTPPDPGATATSRRVPFHRPCFDEREIDAVVETMRSGWITTGERTQEFERRFAEYVGASHAVALNSCTAALHVALAANRIGPGDEVITTPYTFVATVEAICYVGATPVLVDIDPLTRNIDPQAVAAKITGRTKAIMPVHVAGLPCDMEPILATAEQYGIPVIEDAAHSLPADYHGRRIGSLGQATAFSFYATKNLTTAEGGMLTTENAELAARFRLMSLHGIDADGWKRYRHGSRWFYSVTEMGYKYNMTDIAASIGLVQLDKQDRFVQRRAEIAASYSEQLSEQSELLLPQVPDDRTHAWHLYMIRLDPAGTSQDRDTFIDRLTEQGVSTSVHFIPVHLHPYYAKALNHRSGDFPRAEQAFEQTVSLPIFPGMTDDDVDHVVRAVRHALAN